MGCCDFDLEDKTYAGLICIQIPPGFRKKIYGYVIGGAKSGTKTATVLTNIGRFGYSPGMPVGDFEFSGGNAKTEFEIELPRPHFAYSICVFDKSTDPIGFAKDAQICSDSLLGLSLTGKSIGVNRI